MQLEETGTANSWAGVTGRIESSAQAERAGPRSWIASTRLDSSDTDKSPTMAPLREVVMPS